MSLQVSRILHAGYIFEYEGVSIAFDPVFENPFSRNCFAFPSVEFDGQAVRHLKFDAVFISHEHDDHFSLESLNLLSRDTPIYLFSPFEELRELIRQLGFRNVHALRLNAPVHIGPFEVLPLEALDADVDCIFHIGAGGRNILHVVDSWIGPGTFEKLTKVEWDLVLWPFQTMRELEAIAPALAGPASREIPPEWTEQLRQLNMRAIVPSSCQFRFEEWSWLNAFFFPISYAGFTEQVRATHPGAQVLRLNPGESLQLGENIARGPRLPWVGPVGDPNADYVYDAAAHVMSVAEIARKFPVLTAEQSALVDRFCEDGLPRRWTEIFLAEESVFQAPQIWKLSVYDHHGEARHYLYRILQNQLTAAAPAAEWTWQTEISAARLYGALAEGESLSSLYVRVSPAANADPLEDPLIRCLYDGIVGGYLKAQLKRLRR